MQGLAWQSRKCWHWRPAHRKFPGKKSSSQWVSERSLQRFKRSVQSKTTLGSLPWHHSFIL